VGGGQVKKEEGCPNQEIKSEVQKQCSQKQPKKTERKGFKG